MDFIQFPIKYLPIKNYSLAIAIAIFFFFSPPIHVCIIKEQQSRCSRLIAKLEITLSSPEDLAARDQESLIEFLAGKLENEFPWWVTIGEKV